MRTKIDPDDGRWVFTFRTAVAGKEEQSINSMAQIGRPLLTYHSASQRLKEVGARVAHLVLHVLAVVVAVVDHRVPSSTATAHGRRSVCGQVRCVRSSTKVRNEKVDSGVGLRREKQIKIT